MVKYWKSGLLFGLVSIVGIYSLVVSLGAHAGKQPPVAATKPILVQTTKVVTADMPNSVNALGSLSAVQVVTVSSESDGRVSQVYFKNGQKVGKGMPILQLSNTQTQADYQTAVTTLNLDRMKYQRSKLLLNQAISEQDLATLKAAVDQDETALKSKLALLNQKQITAPFTGVLGAFKVQLGDYVKAGDTIVNLVNTSQLHVDYQLSESVLPQLKQGQLVQITSSAYPKKIFYGTVSFISPTVNQDTRSVALQAVIPNDKNLLSPGMFVHVSHQISVSKNAPVVSSDAVMADVKGYYVYKLIGDKVSKVYIETGDQVGDKTRVLKGVNVGDLVVIAGQQKLEDGSVVKKEEAH